MPPKGRALALVLLAVAAGLAGCLSSEEPASPSSTAAEGSDAGPADAIRSFPTTDGANATPPERMNGSATAPPSFGEPVRLDGDHAAREPSIAVGPGGTIYATGQDEARTPEGEQLVPSPLASGLAYSTDGGQSWSDLPAPAGAHQAQPGLEGDVAVDGEGRLYFVDTYLADNTLSRWSPGGDGPTWDFSRPLQGTAGVDDRPWLAAHGDGVVYYLGNNGVSLHAPDNVAGNEDASRIWLSVSEDAGQTFLPRRGFPSSQFCVPAASPADDRTVLVACSHYEGTNVPSNPSLPEPPEAVEGYVSKVHVSRDRGETWTTTTLRPYEAPFASYFPSAAFDRDGTALAVWGEGNGPTRLLAARQTDAGWETMDVTPFEGTLQRVWMDAGPDGEAAAVFYGTHDADPDDESTWHAYALATEDAEADAPVWRLSRISDQPVAEGASPPGDFFQNAYGPEGRLHVVYGRIADGDERVVLYAGQVEG